MTEAILLLIIVTFVTSCIIGYFILKYFNSHFELKNFNKESDDMISDFYSFYDERERAFRQFSSIRKKQKFFQQKLNKEKALLQKAKENYREVCVEKNLTKGNVSALSQKMIIARNDYFKAKSKYQKTFEAFLIIKEKERKAWDELSNVVKKTRYAKTTVH